MREIAVVILAAGQGTRMKSGLAKVLHEVAGRPLLGHVIHVAESLGPARLLTVVGRDADQVRERFAGRSEFVLQARQQGTGHAVRQAEAKLRDFDGDVLVLYGDTPLLRAETLQRMRAYKRETGAEMVLLSAVGPIPGRIVRDAAGRLARIVEQQDATPEELAIPERNTGVYLVDSQLLWHGLASIEDDNEQGELYLTDVAGIAVSEGRRVEVLPVEDPDEALGINTRAELAQAGAVMRRRIALRHMAEGVTFVDPEQTWVDADVEIGRDCILEPGVVIKGRSVLGERIHVKAHTVIEDSRLDDGIEIGPMARLRPGCHLRAGVKIGNFVEVKNSVLGEGTKAAHLAYIGDTDAGAGVNFGCGVVVVNYDGQKKSRSTVRDGAFVGSNVNLVSPVEIGEKAFLAAGSTITTAVPADALSVGRARQRNVEGWVARREGRAAPRGTGATMPVSGEGRDEGPVPKVAAASRRARADREPTGGAGQGVRRKRSAAKGSAKAARKKAARKKAARRKTGSKKAARKKAARKKSARRKSSRKKAARKAAGKKAGSRKAGRKTARSTKGRKTKALEKKAAGRRSPATGSARKKSVQKQGGRSTSSPRKARRRPPR